MRPTDESAALARGPWSAPDKDAIEALVLGLEKAGATKTEAQFYNCTRKRWVYYTITCADQHMPRHMAPVFTVLYPRERQERLRLAPGVALVEPDFPAFSAEAVPFNKRSASRAAARAVDASRRLGSWVLAMHKMQMVVPEAKSLVLDAFLCGALDAHQLEIVARRVSLQPQIPAADVYVACLLLFSQHRYHASILQAARLTTVFCDNVLPMPRPGKLAEPSRGDEISGCSDFGVDSSLRRAWRIDHASDYQSVPDRP